MNKKNCIERWLPNFIVLFLVVLLLMIIFNSAAKASEISNWIIAFANIAMAAAAIGAWRAARKFLSEFFAQEGYRLAIDLINENVIHLGIDNEFTLRTNEAIEICKKLNGEAHTASSRDRFRHALKQLEILHNHHRTWLGNIRSLLFKMKTYGIYPAEGINTALSEMMVALDNMVLQGGELLPLLREDLDAYEQKVKTGSNLHTPFSSKHLAKMKELLQSINDEWNRMVSARDILLSDGKHARTLFVVRES